MTKTSLPRLKIVLQKFDGKLQTSIIRLDEARDFKERNKQVSEVMVRIKEMRKLGWKVQTSRFGELI